MFLSLPQGPNGPLPGQGVSAAIQTGLGNMARGVVGGPDYYRNMLALPPQQPQPPAPAPAQQQVEPQLLQAALQHYAQQQAQQQARQVQQPQTPAPVTMPAPQVAPQRQLPQVQPVAPGMDRFNERTLFQRMALQLMGLDPLRAQQSIGAQHLDQVLNGPTAQDATRQAVAQGVPYAQAAALGRQQATLASPDTLGLYGASGYYQPDQAGISRLGEVLQGNTWQTNNDAPLNAFMRNGGDINSPTGATAYQAAPDSAGGQHEYALAPGQPAVRMSGPQQQVAATPADLWNMDMQRRRAAMDAQLKLAQQAMLLLASQGRGAEAAYIRAQMAPSSLFNGNSSIDPMILQSILGSQPWASAAAPYLQGGLNGQSGY